MDLTAWMELAHHQMVWLEGHRNPLFDAIFLFFTGLGAEPFLLFFVAVGYWVGDRRVFSRAAGMLVVAALLNTWLKGQFLEPRPAVSTVHATGGWSFPSGHAQVAGALWGWMAYEYRARPWLALGFVALALLVSASRPYLGVHYPHDVVVGLALGFVQVAVSAALFARGLALPESRRGRAGIAALGGLAMVGVWLGFHLSVQDVGARLAGAGTGLAVGMSWLRGTGHDRVPAHRAAKAYLLGVGTVGLLAFWLGLKVLLAQVGLQDEILAAFARYVLIGGWVAAGATLATRRTVL